jgi:hypothetical protein
MTQSIVCARCTFIFLANLMEMIMKRSTLLIGALGALTMLSACGGGYYREAGLGGPDVYYDGFYGPYTDGYWGRDGFYYRGGDGHYIHDNGNHFRHGHFGRAHGFHSGHGPG